MAVTPQRIGGRFWPFFPLAFAFSWAIWLIPLLAARGWLSLPPAANVPLLMIGAFGPLVAAFVLLGAAGGWSAVWQFARRALRYRIPPLCLAACLLLYPVLAGIAAWLWARQGGPPWAVHVSLGHLPALLLLLFFLGGSFQEEFGWAFAIDHMQAKWPLLPATIVLGVIWCFWHLPLFFITGLSQTFMPFWAFLVLTVAARIIYVWAYDRAQQSILVTLLFHTSVNLAFNLFTLLMKKQPSDATGFVYFALLSVIPALLIAVTYPRFRAAWPHPT